MCFHDWIEFFKLNGQKIFNKLLCKLTEIRLFLFLPIYNNKTKHAVLGKTGLNGRGLHRQYHPQRIRVNPRVGTLSQNSSR